MMKKIVSRHPETQGPYILINAVDFDPAKHTEFTGPEGEAPPVSVMTVASEVQSPPPAASVDFDGMTDEKLRAWIARNGRPAGREAKRPALLETAKRLHALKSEE